MSYALAMSMQLVRASIGWSDAQAAASGCVEYEFTLPDRDGVMRVYSGRWAHVWGAHFIHRVDRDVVKSEPR